MITKVHSENFKGKPLIVIIAGSTAVGKTALAMHLARNFGMEVVNADSMLVYRYMDIGTAKPSRQERLLVPHHLIDIVDPDEHFDAGIFRDKADRVIHCLWNRNVIPLVVGGTGLYIRGLIRGLCGGIPRNPEIQKRLRDECKMLGIDILYERLVWFDPETAKKLHPHDKQRIIRAIEVYESTGRPLSYFQKKHCFSESPYRAVKIFLCRGREDLYRRIDMRVVQMVEEGLVDEVKKLLDMGYGPNLKAMQSLGYRQMIEYLQGTKSFDDAIKDIQKETRRYAKRQFTWFRKEPGFLWIHADDSDRIVELVNRALNEELALIVN